jgi:hypothetical protein
MNKLFGRKRNVCAHVFSAGVHVIFYQLMENQTIGDRFKIFHISHHLDTVVSYELLNVSICTQRSPQYFHALYREHIGSEIIDNALEVRVILQEILDPFINMTICRTLSQNHGLTHIKIKVSV